MAVGLLTLYLYIPGCTSLKEKRRRLKPLLARLQREFNISVAEMDNLDIWNQAVIGCAMVCNDPHRTRRSLQRVSHWIEVHWLDVDVTDNVLEIL